MERKTLYKDIGEEVEIDMEIDAFTKRRSIKTVISWLKRREKQGATHISFETMSSWESSIYEINIQALEEYEETEEQAQLRIQKELKSQTQQDKRQRENDIKNYERLKRKLGK